MKSIIYPFSQSKKDYPNGSSIIKESYDNQTSQIEYDTEHILKVLNNEDPTQNFVGFPEINKEQLQKLLYVATKNIVEMSFVSDSLPSQVLLTQMLKECRDLLVMCTLIDKSGDCASLVDEIDTKMGWE